MEKDMTAKEISDMHKVIYLAKVYPKKSLKQLIGIFNVSPIDINAAIWRAKDGGYMEITSDHYKLPKLPTEWKMDEDVMQLMRQIKYVLEVQAREELDVVENLLSVWIDGYFSHDFFVAVNMMLEEKVIATYTIYSPKEESDYVFYTLAENAEKRWGEKQFKDKKSLK